jgi:two-component system chemotaxis sensor kinase CheA
MSDDDIIRDFLIESYENLDRLDAEVVVLEQNPTDRDTLASIFRTIHTIKGTSGFLGLNHLESLTHAGENLLAKLRDGILTLNPEITTALLAMVDAVRQMLAQVESGGSEGERNDQALIEQLSRWLDAGPKGEAAVQQSAAPSPLASNEHNIGGILVSRGAASPSQVQEALEQQTAGDPRHLGEILLEKGAIRSQDVVDALKLQQQARGHGANEGTIRVEVRRLDRLMDRMGELVLLRNQIVQYANASEDSELSGTTQRLNLLTTELQEGVMKTRMQPIGNIWSKFPRTVRDLALACGKQVRIEMEGKETEVDKSIIEAIKDPMTHLVRNAVDHGVESPEIRRAAGKHPEGRVFLRAFHEGGHVNIEVRDDGQGLDPDKIRDNAIQKALITAEQAARMTEREITNLIFLPGLTTVQKVSNVSGRGVGLDVVKTNIEKIGGAVDVQSTCGQGTAVRMKIPLTLVIIPALIVTAAGARYAIPQVSLLELVRLEGGQAPNRIELVHGAPVYRLRERLLPLISLNRELKIDGENQASKAATPSSPEPRSTNIVVLRADDRQFGLVVDEINDTEEIVVKPLSQRLKSLNVYAGATIMGDGAVALILDVLGLAQRANVLGGVRDRYLVDRKQGEALGPPERRNAVLLFEYGDHCRMAIDLQLVARLEEFPRNSVEAAAGQDVVQYRGQIMPLVRVSDVLENKSHSRENGDESLHVVVYVDQKRTVGLVVDRILDIVEEAYVVQSQSERRGVLGSAVIQQRVTDILDVAGLIDAVNRPILAAV